MLIAKKSAGVAATLFLTMSGFANPAVDWTTRLTAVETRTECLLAAAEKLRPHQPDFADWVKYQRVIYGNLEKSIRYDIKNSPPRAESLLADWNYLLKRMEQEVEYYRSQPDLTKSKTLNVKDFGAKADGQNDDAPAFRKAFAAANAGPGRQVFIPSGRYLLDREAGSSPTSRIFYLKNFKDVLITGEPGTILITKSPRCTAFMLDDCDNVQLKNFHLTSQNRFFTTGTVTKLTNPDKMEVKIDPNMLSPLDPIFAASQSKGLVRFASEELRPDGKTPVALSVAPHFYMKNATIKQLSGNTCEFTLKASPPVEKIYRRGLRMIFYARDFGNHKFAVLNSRHCRIDRVSLDSSSAMAFLNRASESTFLTNCRVEAPQDTFVATAADGVYFYNSLLGSYIANNTIKDIGDDFINIHTLVRPADRQDGNKLYLSGDLHPELIRDMSRIALLRESQGQRFISEEFDVKSAKVVTTQNGRKTLKSVEVVLDRAPVNLVTREKAKGNKGLKPDLFMFPELQSHGTVIANNIFAHGVSRILPGGSNWLMINNRVDDALGWIVLALVEQSFCHWDEAFFSRNVTIRNNSFTSLHKSVFRFEGAYDKKNMANNTAHFYIEGNQFNLVSRGKNDMPVFYISGVDDIRITGNRINAPDAKGAVFEAKDSRLTFFGNQLEGPFTPPETGINVTINR